MLVVRRFLMGLRGHVVRSILLVIGVASLPLAGLLAYRSYQDSELFREARFAQAQNAVTQFSFIIKERVYDMRRDFKLIEWALTQTSSDSPAFLDMLHSISSHDNFYGNIIVTNANGDVIQMAIPMSLDGTFKHSQAFQRARDEHTLVLGGYYVSKVTGKPGLIAAQPYYDPKGDFAGVILAAISFDFLYEPLGSTSQPEEFSLVLTDALGTRFFRYPQATGYEIGKPVSSELLSELQRHEPGQPFQALDSQGVSKIFFTEAMRLENNNVTGIYILASIPVDFLSTKVFSQIGMDLLLLGLLNLASMGMAWYLAQKTLRHPLKVLCDRANALTMGEYDHNQLPLPNTGEFGELAYAFGRMSRSIAQRDRNLRRLVMTDPLTGLPNRRMLIDQLELIIARDADLSTSCLALACVDIERFHVVNDSLGHAMGDTLLMLLGERLTQEVGDKGQVYRLGGDEFAILYSPLTSLHDGLKQLRLVKEALKRPFPASNDMIHLHATLGVTVNPPNGIAPTEIIRNANLAMQHSRKRGSKGVLLFTDKLLESARLTQFVQNELETAINQGDIKTVYQPIVEAASGKVLGLECLARWQHPERGFISPAVFIPVAEQYKLIPDLGRHVLLQAIKDIVEIRAQNPESSQLFMAVNVSALQLANYQLPALIRQLLEQHALPPSSLHLEITETAAMEVSVQTSQVLRTISDTGIPLSMDDFGTGYSNLAQLARLSFHTLKVDASIIKGVETDERKQALVKAVCAMAKGLGLEMVAEGVETDAQRLCLQSLGLSVHQGYLYARPMPKQAILEKLGKSLFFP